MGFHSRLKRKPNPNSRIEGSDSTASAIIIPPTTTRISNAAPNMRPRKTASPPLPVGESRRRKRPTNFSLSFELAIELFPIDYSAATVGDKLKFVGHLTS